MIFFVRKANSFLSKYKVYIRSSFLYLFSSLFTAVIGILINPFMAMNLSPEDYAIIGYFNSFTLFILPILNFSLVSYYSRNYYRIPEERRQIVSDTILIALAVYGLVALAMTCVGFYYYSQWSKSSFSFYPFAILAFAPIYLNNFLTLYQVKCRLKREAGKYSRITIVNALLSAAIAISLVVIYKYGATGRMAAALIASAITAAFCFAKLFGKLQFDLSVIKDAFSFGWAISLSAMLWYFFSGVDRAMLEKLNDTHTLGFYNVGVQIAGYLTIFSTTISQTLEPDIYKAISDNRKRKLLVIVATTISLNIIPIVVFIVFAREIIGMLTYNRYVDASGFAQILALKNLSSAVHSTLGTIMIGYGLTKSGLVIRIVSAALCFQMFKYLIDHYGFIGAAWGQVLSFVMTSMFSMFFILFWIAKRRLAS